MKKLAAVVVLVLTGAGCASSTKMKGEGPPSRVVIVSIDGLRPEFYLSKEFEAPTLKFLVERGAHSVGTEPIYPSITYPGHTSIATGVSPAVHGIPANLIFSPTDGPTKDWYWGESFIQAPTIWRRAKDSGRTVALIRWPATVGAKVDWLVPEVFSPQGLEKKESWALTVANSTPGLIGEVASATGAKDILGYSESDDWSALATAWLLKTKKPNLTLVHLINVDHIEHDVGKSGPEVQEAIRKADEQVKAILASLDLSEDVLMVIGDHGFRNHTKTLNPNVLFARQGWIKARAGKPLAWKAFSQPVGGSGAVYVKDPGLGSEVLHLLRSEAKGRYRVLDRVELDWRKTLPGALCAIEPEAGYAIGGGLTGELETADGKTRGHHGFLPESDEMLTGFVVAGKGVSPGLNLGKTRLLDVAPTVASLLRLKTEASEGAVLSLASP